MDLQELIERFISDVCAGKVNQTEEAYRGKLRRLTAFFGPGFDPRLITVDDLDRFKLDLQTRTEKRRGGSMVKGALSPFTVRTCLVTVRFLFSWAAAKRYIPYSPMEAVRIQNPPPPHPKAITQDTVIKLLNAAATHGENWERARNMAIVYALRDTGGRATGLVTTRLGDMDLCRGWLMVTEKGDRQRPLPLVETTVKAIKRWLDWRPVLRPSSDQLFLSCRGSGLTYRGLQHVLGRLAEEADLHGERCNLHSFRHAFARDLLLNGAELTQVSALLGHTDTRVTSMYYARWSTRELKDSHDKYSPVLDMPDIEPEYMEELP